MHVFRKNWTLTQFHAVLTQLRKKLLETLTFESCFVVDAVTFKRNSCASFCIKDYVCNIASGFDDSDRELIIRFILSLRTTR